MVDTAGDSTYLLGIVHSMLLVLSEFGSKRKQRKLSSFWFTVEEQSDACIIGYITI